MLGAVKIRAVSSQQSLSRRLRQPLPPDEWQLSYYNPRTGVTSSTFPGYNDNPVDELLRTGSIFRNLVASIFSASPSAPRGCLALPTSWSNRSYAAIKRHADADKVANRCDLPIYGWARARVSAENASLEKRVAELTSELEKVKVEKGRRAAELEEEKKKVRVTEGEAKESREKSTKFMQAFMKADGLRKRRRMRR